MSEGPARDEGQIGAVAGSLDERILRVLRSRVGVDQAAAETIMSGLRQTGPRSDALSVYLDLNHWISLAKAHVGHPDGT